MLVGCETLYLYEILHTGAMNFMDVFRWTAGSRSRLYIDHCIGVSFYFLDHLA
jgi:hypothetical protein